MVSKVTLNLMMLGKTEGRRIRGQQRMRWLDGIIDSMDTTLSKVRAEPNLPASRIPVGVTPQVRRAGETPHLATPPKRKSSVWAAWGETQRVRSDTPRPPSLKGEGRRLNA